MVPETEFDAKGCWAGGGEVGFPDGVWEGVAETKGELGGAILLRESCWCCCCGSWGRGRGNTG